MLLMDTVNQELLGSGPATQGLRRQIQEAARFVVDTSAATLIMTLLEDEQKLVTAARYFFAPAAATWIEIDTQPRIGFLIICDGPQDDVCLTNGTGVMFAGRDTGQRTVPVPFDWNLTAPSREVIRTRLANVTTPALGTLGMAFDAPRAGLILLATLGVLSTRRLWIDRRVDRERLNLRRRKRGSWPLLAYHEVRIDLSKSPVVHSPTGAGSPRPLHFTRAHLRVRHNGRIELVRPHWRGDAQLGVKRPAYRVESHPREESQ